MFKTKNKYRTSKTTTGKKNEPSKKTEEFKDLAKEKDELAKNISNKTLLSTNELMK